MNTGSGSAQSDSGILLAGARLIDGTGARPVLNVDIAVEGDRIRSVMPGSVPGDGGAGVGSGSHGDSERYQRIDCTGLTVMPGLIDAHCHLTFGEPQSNDELFAHRPQSTTMLLAAFNVQKLLLAGVTGVLDPDCVFDLGPALRDGVEAGLVEGPRISAGLNALLTAAGGTAGRMIPDSGVAGYAQVVRDRDEMVRITRQQIKYGADWIKIHVTGLIPGHKGEISVWTLDELRAVCDTAHSLGTPVTAHCRNAESTRIAAEAGVDLILHASYMDDAALEAIVASGSAIAPTFTFLANLIDYGHLVGAGTAQIDIFRGEIAATAKKLRAAYDAGVPLLCGSESGFALTPYGHWHAREMELFVSELGLSPLEAIACGTRNGAAALRLEGEVGTIQEGQLADLIVIDGDPSADVSILGDRSRLRHVITRGRQVNLDRPWPERAPLAGERVGNWSQIPLTWEMAHPAEATS